MAARAGGRPGTARAPRRRPPEHRGGALILGFDTATSATAAAVWSPDGPAVERRDDPPPGARPAHAGRLLVLLEEALEAAGATWDDIDRLAVGVGPGGFTGLRLGVATGRALAQARGIPLVGVSSLEALAAGALTSFARHKGSDPAAQSRRHEGSDPGARSRRHEGSDPAARSRRHEGSDPGARSRRHEGSDPGARSRRHEGSDPGVLAVIDARRGEVFAAAWAGGERVLDPVAIAPCDLAARLGHGALEAPLTVGDGAVRFRDELARAGAVVPDDGSAAHRVSALEVCRLGADRQPGDRDALLPDYRREPDAKPPTAPPK